MKRLAVALLVLMAVAASAQGGRSGREVAGVVMPETVPAAGKTLRLNGMGLRTKLIFKVYVAGLYLENPTRDAAMAISSEQVKRVDLRLLRAELAVAGRSPRSCHDPCRHSIRKPVLCHRRHAASGRLLLRRAPGGPRSARRAARGRLLLRAEHAADGQVFAHDPHGRETAR